MSDPHRISFLDNLRAFVVVLVVVLHGSLIYMDYAPPWWYVVNPVHSVFFTEAVFAIDVPIMMMMFFVSAYFVLPTAQKRSQAAFLRDKFLRIGLPWIVGVFALTPPVAYMAYYSRKVPEKLGRFWTHDFWITSYEQSVYWFLGVLLLFFIVFSVVYRSSVWIRSSSPRAAPPSVFMLGGFWAVMTLAMFLLLSKWSLDDWYHGWYILVIQPARTPLYVGYFILGIIAYRDQWFAFDGYKPRLALWALLWAASGMIYVSSRMQYLHMDGFSAPLLNAINAALFNTFCLSSLIASLSFFQRFIHGTSPLQRGLAASSYGIYYVHSMILYPLAYFFVGIALPLYVKAFTVIALTVLLSWTVSALVLRKLPGLRRVF
jgi:glucan biosynthesis protein C